MSDKLEIMDIPFQGNVSALIPRGLVEYVLPYAMPLPSSYSHEALVGAIIYQNEKIPIVDLSLLCNRVGGISLGEMGKRRLVVVSCIRPHEAFSSYAIIADSAPRLLSISQEDIQETTEEVVAPFFSCIQIERLDENIFNVLDLDALETQLFDN